MRQGGTRPSPRCGASLATGSGERAYMFGGVYDQEDEDDDEGGLRGTFYNDLYLLDLKKFVWHTGECCCFACHLQTRDVVHLSAFP